ncbi:MAG: cation:proton antiporter [Candidatus Izemoplasmataceae bacterium]|jgi:Kef-type K+ transport system membrane component KefB
MFYYLAAESTSGFDALLLLGLMVIIGMFAGRFIERFNIPNITGYIVIGLIIGGLLLVYNYEYIVDNFKVIMSIALGFIAFSIGMELDFKKLKNRRAEVLVITIIQALAAFGFTAIGLFIFKIPLPIALVLGAIAIATEPGPILMLTKRYRSKGPLTDTLVPLHGVEDAFAIIVFGVVLSYAVAQHNGTILTFNDILVGPIYELIFSVIIAFTIGFIFKVIIKKLDYDDPEKDSVVFVTALVAVLISVAIANRGFYFLGDHVHLSPILLPMGVGITFANMSSRVAKHETEHVIDQFSPPIMIAFFTIVGAEIVVILGQESPALGLSKVAWIAIIYIVFRIFGKLIGSWFGAKIMKSDESVRKYLGLCLLPQAQAAIGLAFYTQASLDNTYYGNLVLAVVLIATVVYELFGPFGIKFSLRKCKESDEFGNCVIPQNH